MEPASEAVLAHRSDRHACVVSRFVPAANLDVILEDATKNDRAEVAVDVVDGAKRNVHTDTGGYAKSLRVFDDDRGVGAETTDFAGHIIEYGSINNAAQSPIRKAASEAGKKFEPR